MKIPDEHISATDPNPAPITPAHAADRAALRRIRLKWAGAVVALNSIHNLITAAKRNNQGSLATLTQIEQVLDDLGDSAPIYALDRPRPPAP
jgi:hypothetical protein